MYLTKLVGSFTILDWYMISVWTGFVLIAKLTWIAQEFGIHTLRFCPVAELPVVSVTTITSRTYTYQHSTEIVQRVAKAQGLTVETDHPLREGCSKLLLCTDSNVHVALLDTFVV